MMLKFIIATWLFPQILVAGDFLGNGGGGLECSGEPFIILDFYENKLNNLGHISLGKEQANLNEMAGIYLDRLAVFSPTRASHYRNLYENFFEEAIFLDQLPLQKIPDLGVVIPENCKWKQIVNQNPLLVPQGKSYIIDRDLWGELDTLNQVGLIFHEIIYRESNSESSIGVRNLNLNLSTNRLNTLNLKEQVGLFKQAGLTWMEAQGIQFSLIEPLSFNQNGLRTAHAIENSSFDWHGQILRLKPDQVEFGSSGRVIRFRFFGTLKFQIQGKNFEAETPDFNKEFVELFESQKVKKAKLVYKNSSVWKTEIMELQLRTVELTEKGEPLEFHISEGRIGKGLWQIRNDSELFFDHERNKVGFFWGDRDLFEQNGQKFNIQYGELTYVNKVGDIVEFIAGRDGAYRDQSGKKVNYFKGQKVVLQ